MLFRSNDQGINPTNRYNNCKYYAPNIEEPKYLKQILTDIKGEINSITIIVGDFTPLASMDRFSRQKINRETLVLNDTLNQIDFIGVYRTFHLKAAEYTFFSSAHGTFSRIDHMLDHKSSHSKFKKTEIISGIFYNHNNMRLEINTRKNLQKSTNTWRLNTAEKLMDH